MPLKQYKRTEVEQDVYSLALDRIRRVYELHDTVIVSFSGGKDSTAVLNLTIEVARELGKLPVRVVSFDEEAIAYETEAYLRRVYHRPEVAFEWYCVPMKHRNACSTEEPYWFPWHPAYRDLWVRPMPPEAITEIAGYDGVGAPSSIPDISSIMSNDPALGRVCWLLGLRAAESVMRHRAVVRRTYDNYIVKVSAGEGWGSPTMNPITPQYKAYPIYDWTTDDVWTAPAMYGWDYSAAYDLMEMAGVSPHAQRLAPPFGEQPMRDLYIWAECFPDIWDRLSNRVPGAKTGARYSTTELYAGGKIAKPRAMSWEDYITGLLAQLPDENIRHKTAKTIAGAIRGHYRVTTDPIAPMAPHPESGLAWRQLAKLATRGDTKGRFSPAYMTDDMKADPVKWQKAWDRYRKDLEGEN